MTLSRSTGTCALWLAWAAAAPAQTVIYVRAGASGANNGASWADAYSDLQAALLSVPQSGAYEIWVAAGTYKPSLGDPSVSFRLLYNANLYWGFTGTETSREQRNPDPLTNQTVLSGDLDGDDGPLFQNRSDNSIHVLVAEYIYDAVLDGFAISGGHANGPDALGDESVLWGGGLLCRYDSWPTIANCVFQDNWAANGGGMYLQSCPVITNCLLRGNSAYAAGGGVFNKCGTLNMTDCRFEDNRTECMTCDDLSSGGSGGGAIFNNRSDISNPNNNPALRPLVDRCVFRANISAWDGGAVYNRDSSPVLKNCLLLANSAGQHGGGLYSVEGSNPDLTNCTLVGNDANNYGGGLYNVQNSLAR
jgi:hypothetical protein